jgi:outer membrane protein OmpA-like peptidoglycan-associated protein
LHEVLLGFACTNPIRIERGVQHVWRLIVTAGLLVGSALLGWAMFWPATGCAEPACVRARFALAVEVDAFRQVTPIEFDVPVGDSTVSLRSIVAAGGVALTVVPDQFDLPYKASSGALDRADLHRFATTWRNPETPPGVDAKIYALLAPALVSDTGEPLFGIMFDIAQRQGFAVAPATTVHQFGVREPASVQLLQLRTFAHELLHSLNRRHIDAVLMPDGRLTLEAPTRCISRQVDGHWSLREEPLMAMAPTTIRFFQTAPTLDVLPGKDSAPFQFRRASPTECDDARSNRAPEPARTRWELALRRLQALFSVGTASAAQVEADEPTEGAATPVALRVQAMPAAYPLGYPVAVRIIARNTSDEPLPIKGRLSPSYGILRLEHRRVDQSEWSVLEPLAWFEPIDDDEAMLRPGERTEQTVPVYFGDDGWTFAETGEYEVRVRLQMGAAIQDVVSEAVRVAIEPPRSEEDAAALRPLIDEQGRLLERVGRLLAFGGRIDSEPAWTSLEAAAAAHGDTALGSALRLTLVTQRLRPPIDPRTGERPAPDFGDARDLLADTCTDSGIAALKSQLLERHAGGIPKGLTNRAETGEAAWDGTSSIGGQTMPTYSDPALQPWGPSLHFCFNDSQLRNPVRSAVSRLALQLLRERPARIVIVGHGDRAGTCRYNDVLGLQRAEAVRRALIAGGLRTRAIQMASLGERRPLDFATTGEAHDRNRRVEILIERATDSRVSEPVGNRIVPMCAPVAGSQVAR